MSERGTVLFLPESAYGPTNNCVGIGARMLAEGWRVVFAAEASWAGKLERYGFVEDLLTLAPAAADDSGDAGAFWKEFVRSTAPEFRKPTIEALATFIRPVWQELIAGVRYSHAQLGEIIDRTRPDVVVEDNVVAFPALTSADVPFVRIVSCNPLEVPGSGIPPAFSGLPADDPSGWAEFRAEYDRVHRSLWEEFAGWNASVGGRPLPDLQFIAEGDLNLYVYPEAADYTAARPLGENWVRLDSCVRQTDEPWTEPDAWQRDDRPLIYFSLGSLGSADVDLMRRLLAILAEVPARIVVSMGPLHEDLELAPNMWGAEFLPQASILPRADLVITHGGNNTTTEALHAGKPMIVLPLFWDQHDNAQRVDELGLGVRRDPYRVDGATLRADISRLLGDGALAGRLEGISARIRAADGVGRAAAAIAECANR